MVAGINGNYSPRSLSFVKDELTFIPTENGEITEEAQATMSPDAINIIDRFGLNKNILSGRIDDLIAQNEAQNKLNTKQLAPKMDLSLDDDMAAPSTQIDAPKVEATNLKKN